MATTSPWEAEERFWREFLAHLVANWPMTRETRAWVLHQRRSG